MPLDGVFLRGLTAELDRGLTGMRAEKIHQPERDELRIAFRGGSSPAKKLVISVNQNSARLHITGATAENPERPPMFCMLLRKHLSGAKVLSVSQPGLERVVNIKFLASDELGTYEEKTLVCELMGRYSNVILTDSSSRIIDVLRRVDGDMNSARQLLPGMFYRLPPAQEGRANPLSLNKTDLSALLNKNGGKTAEDFVFSSFFGFSPLVCREVLYISDVDQSKTCAALSNTEIDALSSAILKLGALANDNRLTPVALEDPESHTGKDYTFMHISQYGESVQNVEYPSFSELLEAHYTRKAELEKLTRYKSALKKTLISSRDRLIKKLAGQSAELAKTAEREDFRRKGDILSAYVPSVPKGAKSVRLPDFYADTENAEIEIALDERLTPQQNAAAYYKEYYKLKSAEAHLTALISSGSQELLYVESVLDALERTPDLSGVDEIRRELSESGYIRPEKSARRAKPSTQKPYEYTVSDGFSVYAGRNNVQNDLLTPKLADKNDLWFHVKDRSGSHVILVNGSEATAAAKTDAANLAALHSSAAASDRVSVDYTLVRNVKKPSGSRPGMVIYDRYQPPSPPPRQPNASRINNK
jgi:predicted ribosome quality control (RQC) complex YloA/Tae2 family protein